MNLRRGAEVWLAGEDRPSSGGGLWTVALGGRGHGARHSLKKVESLGTPVLGFRVNQISLSAYEVS